MRNRGADLFFTISTVVLLSITVGHVNRNWILLELTGGVARVKTKDQWIQM